MSKYPLLFIIALLFLFGCKLDTSNTESLPERSSGTSATAEELINEIGEELLSADFSQSEVDTIQSKARNNITLAGLESSTDLTLVTPEVLKGALLGVTDISDHDSKVEAIEILTTCLILSSQDVASESRADFQPNISVSTPQNSITSYAELLKTITSISIQYMDDIGIESDRLNSVISIVVKGISSTIKRAGISDSNLPTIVEEITKGAVSALDEAGKSDSELGDAIDAVTSGVFQGLKEAGVDSSGISEIADEVTSGAVTGIQGTEVEADAVDALISSLKDGITNGLSEIGLSSEEIDAIQDLIDTAADETKSTVYTNLITAFQFLASLNSELASDVIGIINETNKIISLSVPYGTDVTSLIATFTTTGESVTIDGAEQSSGITINDFSSSVVYKVNSSSDEARSYTVEVSISPEYGVTIGSISGNTTESGGSATFSVVLDAQPSDTVSIDISSNDTAEGTVSPSTVTFSTENWDTAQVLTVTGVDDALIDGSQVYQVLIAAAVSSDSNYNGIDPDDVTVVNIDNELLLPDTGYTTDTTSTFGEDADYTINAMSFTDNGTTTTDNNTGLMWQKEDDNTTRDWSTAGTYCDNLSLGGYSDWRLPNIQELLSIADYSTSSPAINLTYFPNTVASFYWSSTVSTEDNTKSRGINFGAGALGHATKTASYYVRCTRGMASSTIWGQDYEIVDDDVAIHLSTGLMWQRGFENNYGDWDTVVGHCESLTLAGYSDWRLPNAKELNAIVDYTKSNPSIDSDVFPDTYTVGVYWVSTSKPGDTTYGGYIAFDYGASAYTLKTGTGVSRCVRGGQ